MSDRFEEAVREAARGLASTPDQPSYHEAWDRGRARRLRKRTALLGAGSLMLLFALTLNLGSPSSEVDDIALVGDPTVATATPELPDDGADTSPVEFDDADDTDDVDDEQSASSLTTEQTPTVVASEATSTPLPATEPGPSSIVETAPVPTPTAVQPAPSPTAVRPAPSPTSVQQSDTSPTPTPDSAASSDAPRATSTPTASTATSQAPTSTPAPPEPSATPDTRVAVTPVPTASPAATPTPEPTTGSETTTTTPGTGEEPTPDPDTSETTSSPPGEGEDGPEPQALPASPPDPSADATVIGGTDSDVALCDTTGDGNPDAQCQMLYPYPCSTSAEALVGYELADIDGNGVFETCVGSVSTSCDTTGDGLGDVPCIIQRSS